MFKFLKLVSLCDHYTEYLGYRILVKYLQYSEISINEVKTFTFKSLPFLSKSLTVASELSTEPRAHNAFT